MKRSIKKWFAGITMIFAMTVGQIMPVFAAPAVPEQTAAYFATVLPTAVPQGTPAAQVPLACANYISSIANYDYPLFYRINETEATGGYGGTNWNAYNEGWDYFNHPEKLFETGMGICSAYGGAHAMMVHSVPINPLTATVDYACPEPMYLNAVRLNNGTHVFSAVELLGTWHYYDVCWYDTSGNPGYLDMPATSPIMADYAHAGFWFCDQ